MVCPDPNRAANTGAGKLKVTAVSDIDEEHRPKLLQRKCLRADHSSLACHGHRRENDLRRLHQLSVQKNAQGIAGRLVKCHGNL